MCKKKRLYSWIVFFYQWTYSSPILRFVTIESISTEQDIRRTDCDTDKFFGGASITGPFYAARFESYIQFADITMTACTSILYVITPLG